jgi:hypothetical protein
MRKQKKRGKNGFLFYNQNVVHGMSRRENHEKPLHNSWKSKALLSLSLESEMVEISYGFRLSK